MARGDEAPAAGTRARAATTGSEAVPVDEVRAEQFIVGAATPAALEARLPVLAARARAAAALGKPLATFVRESGRDWVTAPCRLVLEVRSFEDLERQLLRASVDAVRSGPESVASQAVPVARADEVAIEAPIPCVVAGRAVPGPTVEATVVATFTHLTGYDRESIGLDQDLAADLGIDSLKHAQVVVTLWDHYGLARDESLAIADHPTLRHMVAFIQVEAGGAGSGFSAHVPAESAPSPVREVAPTLAAPSAPAPPSTALLPEEAPLDLAAVRDFWTRTLGGVETAVTHVTEALMHKFVRAVRFEDRPRWQAVHGRPLLYLSNHQTAVEMYLFPLFAAALGGTLIEGVAMRDHGVDWADPMRDFMFGHAAIPREVVAPVRAVDSTDRQGPIAILPDIEKDLRTGRWSLHIAAEGQRERAARYRLSNLSTIWLELALATDCPVVPVRFRGGLPLEDPGHAQDLPLGFGSQDVLIGRPVLPEELRAVHARDRRAFVLEALNRLGPPETEEPNPPDEAFGRDVFSWVEYAGVQAITAVVFRALERYRSLPGFRVKAGEHVFESETDAFVAAGRLGFGLGRPVVLSLPDTPDGTWLKTLAAMTFGAKGPQLKDSTYAGAALSSLAFWRRPAAVVECRPR